MTFVDTGAWIAIFDRDDQYHEQVLPHWRRINATRQRLVTSNFVLAETLTYLARKIRYSYAVEVGRKIYSAHGIGVLRPDAQHEAEALVLMSKWADQRIGFVDCLSFSLMTRLRIQSALAFDRHFALAGFHVITRE